MLQFELTAANATLEEFKPKMKKDEGGKIPCAELVFSVPLDAEVLAFFSPKLRDFIFNEDSLDLAGGMPLRDPYMSLPMHREEEMGGADVKVGFGLKQVLAFESVSLDEFSLTPMAGSVVIVKFRVKCQPTESQAGALYMLQEQPITLTVSPPDSESMLEAA